jgi:hypothetical protein
VEGWKIGKMEVMEEWKGGRMEEGVLSMAEEFV